MNTILIRKQQALRKQEMEAILLRQQQLEETNRQLCEKAGELRRSLRDLDISQDRYQELRGLPDDKLSIQEYVAVSMKEVKRGDVHWREARGRSCQGTLCLCYVFRCDSTRP